MNQEDALDFGRRYTEAWCSLDPVTVASFFEDDGRITVNEGDPCVGGAEIATMAQGFFTDFPDMVVKMDGFRSSGTHAVYLWTLEGTYSGPDSVGNRVVASGWEYWRFSPRGLIEESRGHFDALDYQRQLTAG